MKRFNLKWSWDRLAIPIFVVGILLVIGFSWLVGAGRISGERDALLSRRSVYISTMETVRDQRKERPELEERQKAIVQQTLGSNIESVDSRVRERLFALGATAGLADLSVMTTDSAARSTPAKSEFKRRGIEKELREKTDFVEVNATISGEGSIEQVSRLLGWLQADGWIKRVTQVRLDPNPDGTLIRVSARVTTIFIPGEEPTAPPPAGEYDEARLARLVGGNPFRVPPPPAPVVVQKPKPPPPVVKEPPPVRVGFPYEKWVLTGVVNGPDGPEAWLRNPATNKRKTIRPGGSIGDAVLVEIEGEDAIFRLDEAIFGVRIGRTLAAGRDTSL